MEPYNYRNFPEDLDEAVFRAFRDAVQVGAPAADGALVELAGGSPTTLSEYWRGNPLVIEFGSLS